MCVFDLALLVLLAGQHACRAARTAVGRLSAAHLLGVRDGEGLGAQPVCLPWHLHKRAQASMLEQPSSPAAQAATLCWRRAAESPAAGRRADGAPAAFHRGFAPPSSPAPARHACPAHTQWYLTKFLKLTAAAWRTSTATLSSVMSCSGERGAGAGSGGGVSSGGQQQATGTAAADSPSPALKRHAVCTSMQPACGASRLLPTAAWRHNRTAAGGGGGGGGGVP